MTSLQHINHISTIDGKIYLIEKGKEVCVGVKATSKWYALKLFAEMQLPMYQEYIHSFSLSNSLFGYFYRDEHGLFEQDRTHKLPSNSEEKANYISRVVLENIHRFWNDQTQYALEYTKAFTQELVSRRNGLPKKKIAFSEGFYVDTVIRLMPTDVVLKGPLNIREIDGEIATKVLQKRS